MADLAARLGGEESIATEWDFFGATLYLQRDGKGRPRLIATGYCELRFYNHSGRISAQFTVYSFPFWIDDALSIFQYADGLICEICGRVVEAVPVRLDLARDVVGFDLDALGSLEAINANFVTRARSRKQRGPQVGDGEVKVSAIPSRVETIDFGGHSSPVNLQVYDKTVEAARKGKTYYAPVWNEGGYNGTDRVVRFEARFTREIWKDITAYGCEHGLPVLTLSNLHEWLPSIWSWFAQSHTRMVVPDASETNRSRLKTSSFWCMMQARFDDTASVVIALQRERHRAPERDALGAQSEGTFLSMAALIPGSEDWSTDEIAGAMLDLVGWRCATKEKHWRARVMERRALLAL